MKKTLLKKYINFAIKNGYSKFGKSEIDEINEIEKFELKTGINYLGTYISYEIKSQNSIISYTIKIPLLEVLIDKDFISAIEKGLLSTKFQNTQSWIKIDSDLLLQEQILSFSNGTFENYLKNINNYI